MVAAARLDLKFMPAVYSYLRFSTPKQAQGDSFRRQFEMARKYAATHGWVIDETLNDEGVSAFNGRNVRDGALGAFLRCIEDGKMKPGTILLVESLDRLSRNTVTEQMGLLLSILGAGVEIVTLIDGKRFSVASVNASPSELIVTLALMIRAREEGETRGARIRQAWRTKRSRLAEKKLTARCPLWLRLAENGKEFRVLEERVRLVRKMFRMAREGLGVQMIVNQFTQEGIEGWGPSKRWTCTNVEDVVYNRAVLGEFQPHETINGKPQPAGAPAPDYFPRIIEPELFYVVNATRILNGGGRGFNTATNLFIGLAHDGETGERMQRRNAYLVNERSGKGGEHHRWAYRAFEQNLLSQLERLDWASLLAEPVEEQHLDEKIGIEAQIHEANLMLKRLLALACKSDTPPEIILDQMKRLEGRKADLKKQLLDLEATTNRFRTSRSYMEDAKARLFKLVSEGDVKTRLRLRVELRLLLKRIDLWADSVLCAEIKPHFRLLERAVAEAGLHWAGDPESWPCYRITFANGATRWVLCERSRLRSDDLHASTCLHNGSILLIHWKSFAGNAGAILPAVPKIENNGEFRTAANVGGNLAGAPIAVGV